MTVPVLQVIWPIPVLFYPQLCYTCVMVAQRYRLIMFLFCLCASSVQMLACQDKTAKEAVMKKSPVYSVPEKSILEKSLNPEQFKVTQLCGTEAPFNNEYWDNHESGIYVDIVSGEPLFSSIDKFDSGTGWPSFMRPLDKSHITEKADTSYGMRRVEVRSRDADSHLGHLFEDGPAPTGQRYCINSASLRFVQADKLWEQGYGRYVPAFESAGIKTDVPENETAVLAGGCFWGMEDILRKIPGVVSTEAGYTGGHLPNPRYEDTHDSKSGHAESVEVIFNPRLLSYEDLLEHWFFRMHDPTTLNRQGNDRGTQYRSAIFFRNPVQQKIAERVKRAVDSSGKWRNPVETEITPASIFYRAEEYHQDYLVKNPGGYTCHYMRD